MTPPRYRRPRGVVLFEIALMPISLALDGLELIGRVRRMLASLDEGSRQAREQCAADVEQALSYEEELRDAA